MNAFTDNDPSPLSRAIHVQDVIRSTEIELITLLRQRAELTRRIGSIKKTLTGLANIFGDSLFSHELLVFLGHKSSRRYGFIRTCARLLRGLLASHQLRVNSQRMANKSEITSG